MRDNVLIRKKANIILMLSECLKVNPEKALAVFYSTDVNRMLSDPSYGFQLMSNKLIIKEILAELELKNNI